MADASTKPASEPEKAAPEAASAPAAPEPSPPPAEPVLDERAATVDGIILEWFRQMGSSPISQHTEAWNHLYSRLPALRDAILKGV